MSLEDRITTLTTTSTTTPTTSHTDKTTLGLDTNHINIYRLVPFKYVTIYYENIMKSYENKVIS